MAGSVNAVFDPPELLENILLNLDFGTLLFSQRVNKFFRSTIKGSIHLKRVFWLERKAKTDEPSAFNLGHRLLRNGQLTLYPTKNIEMILSYSRLPEQRKLKASVWRNTPNRESRRWEVVSWAQMLVTWESAPVLLDVWVDGRPAAVVCLEEGATWERLVDRALEVLRTGKNWQSTFERVSNDDA